MAKMLGRRVAEARTGRTGRVVQELNHGFHLRIRWDGEKGVRAVDRVRIEDVEFTDE